MWNPFGSWTISFECKDYLAYLEERHSRVNIITNLNGSTPSFTFAGTVCPPHVQLISVNLHKCERVYEKNFYGLKERALGSDLKNMNIFSLLVVSNTGLLLATFQC